MNYRFAFVKALASRAGATCLLLLCCIGFSGCDGDDGGPFVLSLHPLYTKVDLDFDAQLIGNWKDKDGDVSFVFEQEGERDYRLTVIERDGTKEESGEFDAHLVRLGSEWFLDLYPKELKAGSDFYQLHFLPAHTFMRVQIVSDDLTLRFFNNEWWKARIDDKSVDTPHEIVGGSLLLTGSIQEVQEIVYSHANVEQAFGEPLSLVRQVGTE